MHPTSPRAGGQRCSAAAGIVSGALSFAVLLLPGDVKFWLPGLIFGALVLAPSFSGALRRALLVAASAFIYPATVWLAQTLYLDATPWAGDLHAPSCAVVGGLGALALALATGLVTREPLDRRATWRSVLFGALAGTVIDLSFAFGGNRQFLDLGAFAVCFMLWQGSYAALHRLTPWRSAASSRRTLA